MAPSKKNAFVLIHFGNKVDYLELELYFLKSLRQHTDNDIVYMYSVTDTPPCFVDVVNQYVTESIGYDDNEITFNIKFKSHYTSFNTLRTCNFMFAYTLEKYDKICIIESDLVVMKNVDDIFKLNTPSVFYYDIEGPDANKNGKYTIDNDNVLDICKDKSSLNGGVMVIKPSRVVYNKYLQSIETIVKNECKYPNESLFEYVNGSAYHLPVRYNMSHYHTNRLSEYGMTPEDVSLFHFNETQYKHLRIIKDNWIENMEKKAKYMVTKIPVKFFNDTVYKPYHTEIENYIKSVNEKLENNTCGQPGEYNQGKIISSMVSESSLSPMEEQPENISEIPIIYDMDEAYKIALPFLPEPDYMINEQEVISKNRDFILTKEVADPEPEYQWQISETALSTTLRYIFERLHHSCYMLCVSKDKKLLFKLESKTTSPFFEKMVAPALKNAEKTSLINKVKPEVFKKPFRVMQCVVKPIGRYSTTSEEYRKLLSSMKLLPHGVFILNLTDAVILKRNKEDDGFGFDYGMDEPWPIVTGRKELNRLYSMDTSLPILSTSGQNGYSDIPIPNYDDVQYILDDDENGQKMREQASQFITNWDEKNIDKAVFRGGPTGCGLVPNSNQRLYLATLQKKYPTMLDVGIATPLSESSYSKSIKFSHGFVKGPVIGSLNLNALGIELVNRLSMAEQSRYKYIIHVDGNVHAYRLLYSMLTGSVIIRVESAYVGWMDHMLKPGVHYVPVKSDFSDLVSQIEWCRTNDDKCREIAQNALEFSRKVLTKEYITGAFHKILCQSVNAGAINYLKNNKPSSPKNIPKTAPPKFIPRSPSTTPPSFKQQLVPKSPSFPPPPPIHKTPSPEYIPSPSPALTPEEVIPKTGKRCPFGYETDKKDKTKCRKLKNKNTKALTKKAKATAPPPQIKPNAKPITPSPRDIIEKTGKICPTGYETDKKDKTKCKRKTVKNAKPKTPSPSSLPSPPKIPLPQTQVLVNQLPQPQVQTSPNVIEKTGKKCPNGYKADPKDKTKCNKTKKN